MALWAKVSRGTRRSDSAVRPARGGRLELEPPAMNKVDGSPDRAEPSGWSIRRPRRDRAFWLQPRAPRRKRRHACDSSTGRLPPLQLGEMPALPYEHVFLPQYPVNFRTAAAGVAAVALAGSGRAGHRTGRGCDDRAAIAGRDGHAAGAAAAAAQPRPSPATGGSPRLDGIRSTGMWRGVPGHQPGRPAAPSRTFYFHDVPLEGRTRRSWRGSGDRLTIWIPNSAEIPPLIDGEFFADKDLAIPVPARSVLSEHAQMPRC